MVLEHLLVAVQGKLLAAHWADFPVALHMLLKLALVVVGREDDLTQRASLHVHAWCWIRSVKEKGREKRLMLISSRVMMWAKQERRLIKSICLMRRGWPVAAYIPAEQTHVLQCRFRNCRTQQTWMAFMKAAM